jgi:hypothetical protein
VTRVRPAQNARVPRLLQLVSRVALAAVLGATSGCGLFTRSDPIGFRTYVLEGVAYEEAASIVHEVTRTEANRLFGGVGLVWDPELGNLELDPIYDGQRRLRLFIHLAPAGDDVNVEMFALVDHLEISRESVGYGQPMQDVPLEEQLFQAYVTELQRRREPPG